MKACGLIVEYNPFHNGHLYHVNEARRTTGAQCIIAVMSGPFLQRGEPAIIDKFHRTKAALASGVDLIVELPFMYAVQSSHYFAKGALLTLNGLQTDTICFGSESGEINQFYDSVMTLQENKKLYNEIVQSYVREGLSYPEASHKAYEQIGMEDLDLFQPNNILGFSYVKAIIENNLPIQASTIKRKQSHYHDEKIEHSIASATSIRKELAKNEISTKAYNSIPKQSLKQMEQYKKKATIWHDWEQYYPLLHYKLTSMTREELTHIHGVDEGIEGRLLQAVHEATSFSNLMERIKTKRYTQVRLQRMFVHLLTNTTKRQVTHYFSLQTLPYIRLLGMTRRGQAYLNKIKKQRTLPLIANLTKNEKMLSYDERAQDIYASILPSERRRKLRRQDFQLPIIAH